MEDLINLHLTKKESEALSYCLMQGISSIQDKDLLEQISLSEIEDTKDNITAIWEKLTISEKLANSIEHK